MGDVRSIDEARPHTSGPAKCLHCKYEWHAVAPYFEGAPLLRFECPNCGLERGTAAGIYQPADGVVFECNCGNDLFFITPEGHFCPNCGQYNEY